MYINGKRYQQNVLPDFLVTNEPLQPDGCKLSVLLTFHNNSTPFSDLENLANREKSIDHTVFRI